MVYLGDLNEFFDAASRRLTAGGRLALTAEDIEGPGDVRLKDSRRFGHSAGHLRAAACAAGLVVASLEPIVPRHDRGRPLPGWCLVARRPE